MNWIKDKWNRFKKFIIGLFVIPIAFAVGGTAVVDNQINPYIDKDTYFELSLVTDIPQGERIEIAKDKAEMTLYGWNDEYAIKITPQLPAGEVTVDRPLLSKRIEFKSDDITAFIEPVSTNEFDIDFLLDSKPDTNVFTYVIEGAEDFDFWYQSALTKEELNDGNSRPSPDNITGSYAVYHKTKANHRIGSTNYAVGKILHIYRPKAIDANGNEVWAILSYSNGVLSVEVPQEFLDTAVYPVRVDPTFGYETIGATAQLICQETNDTAQTSGGAQVLSEDGTLDSIHLGLGNTSGGDVTTDTFAIIYREDSAGSGSHDLVVGIERLNLTVPATAEFLVFTGSSETLVTDTYVLAAVCNGEDLGGTEIVQLFRDSSGSHNVYSEFTNGAGAYATRKAEDPWTETAASSSFNRPIFVTYTASGGGASPSVQDIIWFD